MKRILLCLGLFATSTFGMNQTAKEITKLVEPVVNTVVTDIVDRISNVDEKTPETNLKELLDKITNDKTQLKKKNTCLTITTGVVAIIAPIVTIGATTLLTSSGSALAEQLFNLMIGNCTCH